MATEKVTYELTLRDLMTKGLGDINSKLGQMETKLSQVEKKGADTASSLSGAFKAIGFAALSAAVVKYGTEIVYTTARFQSLGNAIKFASDGSVQGEASLRWLGDLSNKYGLPLEKTIEGFKTFQGAMIQTKFTSSDTRKMFAQVSTGIVAMGLSADDAKGTFLALGQIMGKGKVQAEELRGQIGERIPGAFSLAARAMGVTTSQLDKLMKDGKLLSEDFLPKFAAEMEKTFGKGAEASVNSLSAGINRLGNSWDNLMVSIGNSDDGMVSKGLGFFSKLMDSFADGFKSIEQRSKEAMNPRLIKYLDEMDERSKSDLEGFKKKGLRGNALTDALQAKGNEEYSNAQEAYKVNHKKRLQFQDAILTQAGHSGKISEGKADKLMQGLIDANGDKLSDKTMSTYKSLREQDEFLKAAMLGSRQIYDKRGDISQLKSNTGSGGDDKLKDSLNSVSGGVPKVVNINIDALIGTNNNTINNVTNPDADLETFMQKLERGLLTIVNDTNIVTDYGR